MKKWVAVTIIGAVVLVAAVAVLFLRKPPVNSFHECVQAGYPVRESYPAVCATPDGKSFTDPTQRLDAPYNEGEMP